MDERINPANLPYIEQLYIQYLTDRSSVPSEWQGYFANIENGDRADGSRSSPPDAQAALTADRAQEYRGYRDDEAKPDSTLQSKLNAIIDAYRRLGHKIARIDPLNLRRTTVDELDPRFHGFTDADMKKLFVAQSLNLGGPRTLQEIVQCLRETYCGALGVEFLHIEDRSITEWLQERMESTRNRLILNREQRRRIFMRLNDAVTFEEFIRRKFVGAKSFSLEGAESLLPLLDFAIELASDSGVQEIVLAMAHRGRLNVLANIIGKPPSEIFREFDEAPAIQDGISGDVKYHLGCSSDYDTASGGKVHLSLCFNPSHLEFVNPVALGRMRAKQDRFGDLGHHRGMLLLMHGDASFAGEGVVQEVLNLSQLDAYDVGGTLHVIINNQIGFTTPPSEGRSTPYATDVAKMLQIPIFHVNSADPEAVAQAVQLAMDFRRHFKRDAVIDMYCYRRFGHNETDEPTFTQPLVYRTVASHKPVRQSYLERLLEEGCLTREEANEMAAKRRDDLERELSLARSEASVSNPAPFGGVWAGYFGGAEPPDDGLQTGLEEKRVANLLAAQTRIPEGFHIHPKLKRAIESRSEMASGKKPLDWSAAEALAFASLASEGTRIRLSGQDSARGTFSQRHAVLYDYENGRAYTPLKHLSEDQASVEIYNSPLSEVGVLGFDYGYSLDSPEALVLWEAQFGDFCNAGQVIIDQFITTAEEKWRRLSGLVLLLPHGFEGMGPEHSSARMERFLHLAARDNIQVIYPTTPAQYFHCLRRQALRKWRKPLVVMTPKSLLRHPRAVSGFNEFNRGSFQRIIPDTRADAESIRRVILCTGKIYYELDQKREELSRADAAIIRIEQLYPLDRAALSKALGSYSDKASFFWVQEEPENMGAWPYLSTRFPNELFGNRTLSVICRQVSASPATGSSRAHREQQSQLISAAFE